MSLQSWSETLVTAQSDGTALASSTTATSIIPAAAKFTLPANFFSIGKQLRIVSRGRISTVVTTPGSLTLDIRLGSTVAFSTQAQLLNIVAKTNVTWEFYVLLTCRQIGTSANLMGIGSFSSEAVIGATAGFPSQVFCPISAPVVGTGFDSTTSQVIDHFATFSISNAVNALTLHQYQVEALN